MPSLGLAWNTGQRLAQEAARGDIRTIADMYQDAKRADEMKDYWNPTNVDARKFAKEERQNVLNNMRQFIKFKEKVAQNPESITEFYKEKYGTDWKLNKTQNKDGVASYSLEEIGADGKPTGRKASYSSMNQMISDAALQFFVTTPEMLNVFQGRAAAETQISNDIYKFLKTIGTVEAMKDATNRYQADQSYRGTIGSASIHANASRDVAGIGKMPSSKDLIELGQETAAGMLGYTKNKDGEWKDAAGNTADPIVMGKIMQGGYNMYKAGAEARARGQVNAQNIGSYDPIVGMGYGLQDMAGGYPELKQDFIVPDAYKTSLGGIQLGDPIIQSNNQPTGLQLDPATVSKLTTLFNTTYGADAMGTGINPSYRPSANAIEFYQKQLQDLSK
jgi:hypothetical protein